MGRDIYTFVERRKAHGKWECIATDEDIMAYRAPDLFAYLSYNAYEGAVGVIQKPLREWVTTLSIPTRNYMFSRINAPIKGQIPLFQQNEIDYNDFISALDDDFIGSSEARRWIDKRLSFLLTDDIISNPDACFWNWCSVEELTWAMSQVEKELNIKLGEDDDYRKIVALMKENEAQGYEVRMVYSYDNSTEWVGCLEDNESKHAAQSKEDDTQTNNPLILFILQCRAEDFKRSFEAQDNRCFMGVYTLYQLAYCNYLILSDNNWEPSFLPIIETCRRGCREILDYLKTLITIPISFQSELVGLLKRFSYYYENEDIDTMLNGSISKLVSLGYREIDCRLYEAGMKLNYSETERLLNQGANPTVYISGDYSPSEAEKIGCSEASCLTTDVNTVVCDAIDLNGIESYWKTGVNKEEHTVLKNDIRTIFQAAAYRIMENIISEKTRK